MIEENSERDGGNCAYVFELLTPKICQKSDRIDPATSDSSKLAIFSIILIV